MYFLVIFHDSEYQFRVFLILLRGLINGKRHCKMADLIQKFSTVGSGGLLSSWAFQVSVWFHFSFILPFILESVRRQIFHLEMQFPSDG